MTSLIAASADAVEPCARLPAEWRAALSHEASFRAEQVFRWIHARGVFDAKQMTDLPQSLRDRLHEEGLAPPLRVVDVRRSQDRTRKLVLSLFDGGQVECVLIPMTVSDADADAVAVDDDEAEPAASRVTLCVSTQVGCAMGCVFCASGRAGLKRGLTAGEIVAQVLVAKGFLESGERLHSLVFMGMGEPLHHYDQTARALRLLSHPQGQNLSLRRITVSTVGLVPGLERLGRDFGGKVGLAVSLHGPNDAVRGALVPMNRRYPVAALMGALRAYPLPRRRRITIEYTLIEGQNDGLEHARELTGLLRGLPVKVNLIPMNPVAGLPWCSPSGDRVDAFQKILVNAGYSCFVRKRRGDDVDAACGQLALTPLRVEVEGVRQGPRSESR